LNELKETVSTNVSEAAVIKDLPIASMHLRDYGSYLGSAVCILLGVVVAFGILWYTVLPAKQSEYEKQAMQNNQDLQTQLQQVNAEIGLKDQRISELEESLANLEDVNNELEDQQVQTEEKITKRSEERRVGKENRS